MNLVIRQNYFMMSSNHFHNYGGVDFICDVDVHNFV